MFGVEVNHDNFRRDGAKIQEGAGRCRSNIEKYRVQSFEGASSMRAPWKEQLERESLVVRLVCPPSVK